MQRLFTQCAIHCRYNSYDLIWSKTLAILHGKIVHVSKLEIQLSMKCCASPCDILQSYYTHVKSKVFIYLYAYTYEYKLCSFFFKNKLSKVLLLSNILFCVSCIHFSSLGESWFFILHVIHIPCTQKRFKYLWLFQCNLLFWGIFQDFFCEIIFIPQSTHSGPK